MAKKANPKGGSEKPRKPKAKKEVVNLESLPEADVVELYKKLIKKPLLEHKLPELIRQLRVYYAAKKIVELPIAGLILSPKNNAKNPPKHSRENYTFNHRFTDSEIREKSAQLADTCIQKKAIEDEKKTVMSDYTHKLNAKEAEINLISNSISSGFEKKTVTCEVRKDFPKGEKTYWHEGDHIGTEKLTAADHQLQMDIETKQEEDKDKNHSWS